MIMLAVGLYAFILLLAATLTINGLKDIFHWDGRAFGAIVAIFLAVLVYY